MMHNQSIPAWLVSRLGLLAVSGAALLCSVAFASSPDHETENSTDFVTQYPAILADFTVHQRIELQEQLSDAFGLYSCRIESIPRLITQDRLTVHTRLGGLVRNLTLNRHSLRSANFRLLVDDGNLQPVEPPAVRTYRGWVVQDPAADVAASISEDGQLHAMILKQDEEAWYIQPVSKTIPGAPVDWHIVYRGSDVKPTQASCGVDETHALGKRIADRVGESSGARSTQATSGPSGLTEIAFDADVEFYQLNGSSVANTNTDIEMITNFMDLIYHAQVGICYTIPGIVVRTVEPDPYTTSNSDALLCEFTGHWNSTNPVSHDVAHLMTGRNFDGSVIGVAWGEVICGEVFDLSSVCPGLPIGTADYGLSQSQFPPSLPGRINLTAHELGHNWSACHCNETSCTSGGLDPDCGIMWGTNFGSVFFGGRSVSAITAHRDTRTCLSGSCGAGPSDCDGDGVPDELEIATGTETDCNGNSLPDDCELIGNDCNGNTQLDECDINFIFSVDCNGNIVPDECEFPNVDCNSNGIRDGCELEIGSVADCNMNSVPDSCDLTAGTSPDCNSNVTPDECDIARGVSGDCDLNDVPDDCESPDCPASLAGVSINSGGRISASGVYAVISSTGQSGGVGILNAGPYELSDGFWFTIQEAIGLPAPTMSQWGLIVMSVLMVSAGTIIFNRRRRAEHSRL
jgi:Metallo-peptidase family M12/IPTL-CTERM motif